MKHEKSLIHYCSVYFMLSYIFHYFHKQKGVRNKQNSISCQFKEAWRKNILEIRWSNLACKSIPT